MADAKILYFAWVRERIGRDEDVIDLADRATLQDLVGLLSAISPGHAAALSDLSRLRAAVNQDFVPWTAEVRPGDEIAIFPPVTGG